MAYQNGGDVAFWGNLIEPGHEMRPSALLQRLTDSIFFFLDANVAPLRTGYLEPSKVAYWNNSWSTPPTPFRAEDVDAYNRLHCEVWTIPIRIVTAPANDPQGGRQIGIFDRSSFMMSLIAAIRSNPDDIYKAFQSSIFLFRLVDPLTHQPFPPLPRSALPSAADPIALQNSATINVRFTQSTQQRFASLQSFANWQSRGYRGTNELIDDVRYVRRDLI